MYDIEIKPLTPADEIEFYDHCDRSVKDGGKNGAPPYTPFGQKTRFSPEKRKITMDGLSLAITKPGWFRIWAVWFEDKIIGHIMLNSLGLETLIHRSHLSMNLEEYRFRNMGIGSQMLDIGVEWAKQQPSLRWIDLGVFDNNPAAVALYKKFHFQKIGQLEDHFFIEGKSYTQVLMTLKV